MSTPTRREETNQQLAGFLDALEVEMGLHYTEIGITSVDAGIVSPDVSAISWDMVRQVLSRPASATNDQELITGALHPVPWCLKTRHVESGNDEVKAFMKS